MQDNSAHKKANPADQLALLNCSYIETRAYSNSLVTGLTEADVCVQSMPDASPAKWHLAHTTWFFETFILKEADASYKVFNEKFNYLFNSYYETVGKRHARPNRGMLTRPMMQDVFDYRAHVDAAMQKFLSEKAPDAKWLSLLELGVNHEQQHQELLLTDVLHLFAQNPMKPEYMKRAPSLAPPAAPLSWKSFNGGVVEAGHNGKGFLFDCEGPQHKVYLNPYALATRLVTAGEYIEFMQDGGYSNPMFWLADGWAQVKAQGWDSPLYWEQQDDGQWGHMTLQGFQPVELNAPVANVSFYEAQAFAFWAGARLPTEFEWENAAAQETSADFTSTKLYRPAPLQKQSQGALEQLYGDVWQWTSSAYMPYPGFKPAEGAVGEYNGKFMSSQFVLRGGSCATPTNHTRLTYRNFFYPHQRWQFTGLRLAKDVS